MINRQSILHWIAVYAEQAPSLDEQAAEFHLSSITEAVRQQLPTVVGHDARPVPLETVAAYVDGRLAPEAESVVTERLSWDQELLFEVVSATLANIPEQSLSNKLTERLLNIAVTPAKNQPDVQPEMPVSAEIAKTLKHSTETPLAIPKINTNSAELRRGRKLSDRRQVSMWLWGFSVAATVVFVTLAWFHLSKRPTPLAQPQDSVATESIAEESGNSAQKTSLPTDTSSPNSVAQNNTAQQQPQRDVGNLDAVQKRDSLRNDTLEPDDNRQSLVETNDRQIMNAPSIDEERPSKSERTKRTLRVQKIHGLMVQRSSSYSQPTTPITTDSVIDFNPTSSSALFSSSTPTQDEEASWRSLQTLPRSRAEAQYDKGGTIVFAADSEVQLSVFNDLRLASGAIAFLEVPDDFDLTWHGDQAANTGLLVKPTANSRFTIAREGTAVRVVIGSGTLTWGDMMLTEGSYLIDGGASGNVLQPDSAPARLPEWCERPVDRIELPKSILAQLTQAADLRTSLEQQIASFPNAPVVGQVSPQRLLLCQWLASTADDDLLSLLSSADAMVRLVALERISSCLPNDPRHDRVWEGIRRELNNDADSRLFYQWFQTIWNKAAPNARQAQQILRNLEQPEVRRRVLADYLLRKCYGDGPPFEPTMNRQTAQRVIAIWQQRIRRSQQP